MVTSRGENAVRAVHHTTKSAAVVAATVAGDWESSLRIHQERSVAALVSQKASMQGSSDLESIFKAYVARSVGTEGVAAAVGGASSAAGSGRGSRQTNVLLKDVFDTTW